MTLEDFAALIMTGEIAGGVDLSRLYDQLIVQSGGDSLDDDFSVMRFAL